MFRIVSQTSDLSPEPPRLGDQADRVNQSLDDLNRPPAIVSASDRAVTLAARSALVRHSQEHLSGVAG